MLIVNLDKIKRNIQLHAKNALGWRTERKILIFESDDWGSIRMPSRKVAKILKDKGINIGGQSERYNKYDCLANSKDLESLFQLLSSFKDSQGSPVVFTAMSLVANPDFEKIKAQNFEQYYFETFDRTLARYPNRENTFGLWKEGIEANIFCPQFHGREHLNVAVWMKDLKQGEIHTRTAFDNRCWGVKHTLDHAINYQAAFNIGEISELKVQNNILISGLNKFQELFGYKATFFVPPNGSFHTKLEKTLSEEGIRYISTSKVQKEPQGKGKIRKLYHYLGQANENNQIYLTRNCFFEPSSSRRDWINTCLKEIDFAFKWNKPAIVSTHRVNYIGALHESNRANGLKSLKTLLEKVLRKWPNVEFMTSAQLGEIIYNSKFKKL